MIESIRRSVYKKLTYDIEASKLRATKKINSGTMQLEYSEVDYAYTCEGYSKKKKKKKINFKKK